MKKSETVFFSFFCLYEQKISGGTRIRTQIIEKEGEIKQMKLQKKNDDLVSQIESTAGRGNELGELEFMQMDMPATTRAGGTRNLIS